MAGEPPRLVFEGNPLRETAVRLALEEHEMKATTGSNKQCRCDGQWRTFREHREHVAKAIEADLCAMGY